MKIQITLSFDADGPITVGETRAAIDKLVQEWLEYTNYTFDPVTASAGIVIRDEFSIEQIVSDEYAKTIGLFD